MAEDDILDGLLAEAAKRPEVPSAALMARIQADALAQQPRPAALPARPDRTAPAAGWFGTLADWFGGGLSLAGMSAAAVTGLFLGVAQPASVVALAEVVTGTSAIETIEILPGSGTFWAAE